MNVADLGQAEAQLDDARALIREIKALEERLAMLARQAGGNDADVLMVPAPG